MSWKTFVMWFLHEGWVVLLACLVLVQSLYQTLMIWRMQIQVKSIDLRQYGTEKKIADNYTHAMAKIGEVDRRATQPSAGVRISSVDQTLIRKKKRVKKEEKEVVVESDIEPEDFDDK